MARRGRGEGNLYQRPDGLWVGRLSLGIVGGKRRRRAVYGRTRRQAAERLTAELRAQHRGETTVSGRLSVGTYLEGWLRTMEPNVRGSTFLRYSGLVHRHLIPRLGRVSLSRLMPQDCAAAYAAMVTDGLAPRTAGHAHRVLGRALRDAEIQGLVSRNVARLTRPPRVPHTELSTLSAEQARSLLAVAEGDRLVPLYALALATGAREGELLGLKWADIDWGAGVIRIRRALQRTAHGYALGEPKTEASRRSIPIGPDTLNVMRRHRAAQLMEARVAGTSWEQLDLVFSDELGRPLDARRVVSGLRRNLAKGGLPRLRFHDLRHTAATLLLAAGTHPRVVAERLGHSTPAITMSVYSHVTPTMQREATAALEAALHA